MRTFLFLTLIIPLFALKFEEAQYTVKFDDEAEKDVFVIVTNDQTESIHVAISFNQTLNDDLNPLTTYPLEKTTRSMHSAGTRIDEVVTDLFNATNKIHRIDVATRNTKEELLWLKEEISNCLQSHQPICGFKPEKLSSACSAKVQILPYSGMVRLNYADTFSNCQESDIWADLRYLESKVSVDEYHKLIGLTRANLEQPPENGAISSRLMTDGAPPVNDPYFDKQQALHLLEVPEAWKLLKYTPDDFKVLVEVIAAGYDMQHPDLKDNLWVNEAELNGLPGVDDDGNGFVDDIKGWNAGMGGVYHEPNCIVSTGFQAAGVIGAIVNNTKGVAGYSNNIQIAACGMFHPELYWGEVEDILECGEWGLGIGARIVVQAMEFRISENELLESPETRRLLQSMQDAGTLVVTTGTVGLNLNEYYDWNACFNAPNQISVTSAGSDLTLEKYYPWGDRCLELAAPKKTYSLLDTRAGFGADYGIYEDLTYPGAHVGGIAALILHANPYLDALEIKRILRNSITPLPAFARPITLWGGIPSAREAIELTRPKNVKPADGREWDELRFQTISLSPGTSMIYRFKVAKATTNYLGDFVAYDVDRTNNYKVKDKVTAKLMANE